MKTVGASYLVAANLDDPEFKIERTTVAPVIAAHPERFEKIFANARFTLYRLR